MHKNTTKCNKTQSKWCINKHGASKIIDIFETYQRGWAVRGSNGTCDETTWCLALLPQACRRSLVLRPPEAGPVETLESVVAPGPMWRVL
jgi:hypothetical protein